jgi:hypothetical protein
MLYARINLTGTNYQKLDCQKILDLLPVPELQGIYKKYCDHKHFKSVMPIFDSEFTDPKNDVIGYYDRDKLIAFSLMRRYDADNVEAIQFAWDYANPKLRLGIESLKSECALYKEQGFKYLYLGGADEYKRDIDCFELLGPL